MIVASKRKVLLIVGLAVVAILIVGLATYLYLQHKNKSNSNAGRTIIQDYNKKIALEGLKKQITNPQVLDLGISLQSKEYDQVIAKAKTLCTSLTGNDQVLCYNQYGQALLAKNDLKTLSELCPMVLSLDAIKNNDTALKSWQNIQKSVSQGINPNSSNDAEARS